MFLVFCFVFPEGGKEEEGRKKGRKGKGREREGRKAEGVSVTALRGKHPAQQSSQEGGGYLSSGKKQQADFI